MKDKKFEREFKAGYDLIHENNVYIEKMIDLKIRHYNMEIAPYRYVTILLAIFAYIAILAYIIRAIIFYQLHI